MKLGVETERRGREGAEGKAENEIENSKENSTLVPEMGNSECFTP